MDKLFKIIDNKTGQEADIKAILREIAFSWKKYLIDRDGIELVGNFIKNTNGYNKEEQDKYILDHKIRFTVTVTVTVNSGVMIIFDGGYITPPVDRFTAVPIIQPAKLEFAKITEDHYRFKNDFLMCSVRVYKNEWEATINNYVKRKSDVLSYFNTKEDAFDLCQKEYNKIFELFMECKNDN